MEAKIEMSHQGIAVLLGVVLSGGVGLGVEAVGSGAPDVGVGGGVEFLGVESLGASGEAFDAPVVLSGILAWGRNRDCRTHHLPEQPDNQLAYGCNPGFWAQQLVDGTTGAACALLGLAGGLTVLNPWVAAGLSFGCERSISM